MRQEPQRCPVCGGVDFRIRCCRCGKRLNHWAPQTGRWGEVVLMFFLGLVTPVAVLYAIAQGTAWGLF